MSHPPPPLHVCLSGGLHASVMRKRGAPRLLSALKDLRASDVDVSIGGEAHIVAIYSGQKLAVGAVAMPGGSQALTLHLSDEIFMTYR